ncbi:MAG: MFS transporter [bacterium]|nr:MFS transporter [bacterium]
MTTLRTNLPARLDRLPFGRWHWRVVVALGITWILDGLEVTIVGAVASVLTKADTLALTDTQVGFAASAYLAGAIGGALVFGRLSDRYGRKRLFLVTLGVYLVATLLTACTTGPWSFALMRALTGAGIGGEYAAINSAIDELLPARVRGHADLAINGSYWLGAALGALLSIVLLDERLIPPALGWRLAFSLGAVLGLAIILIRRHLPESPRWLILHGRVAEAEAIVSAIERAVIGDPARLGPPPPAVEMRALGTVGYGHIARVLLSRFRTRSYLGVTLMFAQAFAYNAIFFTYALVLTRFHGVPPSHAGWYLLPFAAGNFLGPLLLGRLFDVVGRRPMITLCYGTSGVLLAATGWAFQAGLLTATTQTLAWSACFFVASAAASSAYLTVSELFPVELRATAIALFFAVGTGAGGVLAPTYFAHLVESGSAARVFVGYLTGAALMGLAALAAWAWAVPAERRSLEALNDELLDRAP